jgi:hypothetical protein
MNTTNFFRSTLKVLSILTVLVMVFAQAVSVSAQSTAPVEESITVQKKGEAITVKVLKGFDPNEFGGDDSGCTFSGSEPEMIHIGEVVGSPNEACLQVIEWSLKKGDGTIVAGTYALAPHEWFYIPMAVAGVNDEVRVVGTLYRMPKDWNAHMMAVYYAIDRDARDGTHSYIGLSPTDPWVLAQIDSLSGRSAAAIDTVVPSTPLPISTPSAPVYDEAYAKAICAPRLVDSFDPQTGKVQCQLVDVQTTPTWVQWFGDNSWLIFLLVIFVALLLLFRRSSVPVKPVAPKATTARRKPATKKKSTKK